MRRQPKTITAYSNIRTVRFPISWVLCIKCRQEAIFEPIWRRLTDEHGDIFCDHVCKICAPTKEDAVAIFKKEDS